MAAFNETTLQCQLETISDTELASLIIEFASSDGAALALAEETLRRLTQLRVQGALGQFAQPQFVPAN